MVVLDLGNLKITDKIRGDIGEVLFEHFSQPRKWAYITSEEIYRQLTGKGKIVMRIGYSRIDVALPKEIREELFKWCQPSRGEDGSPAFTCDYFTMDLSRQYEDPKNPGEYLPVFEFVEEKETWVQRGPVRSSFCKWVEVKTGKAQLSTNQTDMAEQSSLQMAVFRINYEPPSNVDVKYDWASKK